MSESDALPPGIEKRNIEDMIRMISPIEIIGIRKNMIEKATKKDTKNHEGAMNISTIG